jgi:hypothetical protein
MTALERGLALAADVLYGRLPATAAARLRVDGLDRTGSRWVARLRRE